MPTFQSPRLRATPPMGRSNSLVSRWNIDQANHTCAPTADRALRVLRTASAYWTNSPGY